MGHNLSQVNKIDSAMTAASIDGTATGLFFSMSVTRKALFVATLGAIANGATAIFQVVESTDSLGSSAKDIADKTVTVTGGTNASAAKLAIVSAAGGVHVAGETVTINGLVFTAAVSDVPESRVYAVGSTGAESAANLLAKINSEDSGIGISDILAIASVESTNSIITLVGTEPGETLVNAVASSGTTVVSTSIATAFVEVDASEMDINNGFSHLAIKVTTSAAISSGIALIRDHSRYTPEQFVAASVA